MNKVWYAAFLAALLMFSCERNSLEEQDSLLSLIGLGVSDTEAPVVTQFTGPATTTSSTVPVSITATDNVGISRWMITETTTPPAPTNPGWLLLQPSSYTITSGYGTYELYLWACDSAGNVSALSADTHFTVDYTGAADGTPPVVSYFAYTCTNPTNSSLIPVDITATDDVGVTGYIITESAVTPDLADPNWNAVQPASYTISTGYGTYELYVWARDLAGNVSLVNANSHFSITYADLSSPTVTVDQDGGQPDPTNAVPITFTVVFSKAIDPATFDAATDITQGGTATGITWNLSTLDNITWTLEATAVLTPGTVVPSIAANMVQDTFGNVNTASISSDNSVDYDATPVTVSIEQEGAQPDPTNALPIEFTVVFNKAIDPASFDTADITQGGTATGITWNLSTSDNITWTLEATAVSASGTLIPSIAASMVQDTYGNANTASTSSDNSVTYDITPPTVMINQDGGQPDPANALPVTFTVVFSKAINPATFATADITQGGNATGITWNLSTSDNITWTLEATAVSASGTLIPSIAASMVQDPAGNPNSASTSSDNSVMYDFEAPVITTFANAGANPTTDQLVPVTIAANDGNGVGITGWMITTTATAPLASDSGWLGAQPSSYLLKSIPAVYTLYLWTKDGLDHVSASHSFMVEYQLPAYPAPVLQTGLTACYDELGNSIVCSGTGQDGEYQYGLAWNAATRFTDNADGTITDNTTGLIWAADADPAGLVTWDAALTHVSTLNTLPFYCGRSDWRLPNIVELMSIMNYGTGNVITWFESFGFTNFAVSSYTYWTSTTYMEQSGAAFQARAWTFNFGTGQKSNNTSKSSTAHVWVVAGNGILPQTGLTTCWDSTGAEITPCTGTGQDGEHQAGVAWPGTRFTHNGDGTSTDNLTGLMWTTDVTLMETSYSSFDTDEIPADGQVYWETALAYIDQLNMDSYAGYSDWRLPNINELLSVHQHAETTTQLSAAGFTNGGLVQTCWSSTTSGFTTANAYLYNILYGNQSASFAKTGTSNSARFVWPVRGGN